MKFEKHLKSTGVNAVIFKASNGSLFLRNGVFGNVLARIPEGCAPISSTTTRDLDHWMDDIVISGHDLPGTQIYAARLEAEGKPKDILRIYRDILIDGRFGDSTCTISQDAYSLIEHYDDVRIFTPIPEDDRYYDAIEHEIPALVIVDRNEEVIGIILGE